ncbi:hypothetical protein AC578_1766 [Lecanosticta acicola]|uniref:Uncharacterized protein n=1 Tax=Lecanosticta acicola TaxID=111012 RepID=A0AAI8Z1M1_9PEZI|nr:hypothetical protein AC578_1766 [Lecanosticta acicola]
MGKAYSQEQRDRVKGLLEAGRDEEFIEKETGVSDRTIRRWKLELERTGRIGKPPESRTGRHRVLTDEIEAALFEHVKDNPDMSVDDMLWWLYDTYKLVVGTRTIRRVFERKGDNSKKGKGKSDGDDMEDDEDGDQINDSSPPVQGNGQYQSPYAPMAQQSANAAEQHLAHAFQQQQQQTPQQRPHQQTASLAMELDTDLPDDEETIQLQLQQIALQKREVELKLKMRRLQNGQSAKSSPVSTRKSSAPTPGSGASSLYNPNAVIPQQPKRDSRSKKKIEESKKRTAERQERMLRDLERRSRRRDHLTAEWVQSKDIWPLRAQGMLADLMHQYSCYAFSQAQVDTFEAMYRELYQLVDLQKGDWIPQIHDEMLRERMKRKMGQLRTKMQKTGEIVGRTDGYGGTGFHKAEDYTGEQAGAAIGDESEMIADMPGPAEMQQHDMQQHDLAQHELQQHDMQQHDMQQHDMQQHELQQHEMQQHDMQAQAGAPPPMHEEHIQYEPVPDHHQMASNLPYGMMTNQGPPQYPMMDQNHPGLMAPYMSQLGGQMNGNSGVMGL